MGRSTSLAFVLAATLSACSSSRSDIQAPPDQRDKATETSELTPQEQSARFSYTEYPDETVVETGGFGQAAGGLVVAASSGKKVALADLYASGPVVLIFYRGHW